MTNCSLIRRTAVNANFIFASLFVVYPLFRYLVIDIPAEHTCVLLAKLRSTIMQFWRWGTYQIDSAPCTAQLSIRILLAWRGTFVELINELVNNYKVQCLARFILIFIIAFPLKNLTRILRYDLLNRSWESISNIILIAAI